MGSIYVLQIICYFKRMKNAIWALLHFLVLILVTFMSLTFLCLGDYISIANSVTTPGMHLIRAINQIKSSLFGIRWLCRRRIFLSITKLHVSSRNYHGQSRSYYGLMDKITIWMSELVPSGFKCITNYNAYGLTEFKRFSKLETNSYQELRQATNGFCVSNLLGAGCFGSVYQGTLSEGLNVAIKVFNLELEGALRASRSSVRFCAA